MNELTFYLDKTDKIQFCKWLSFYCKKKQVANRTYPYMGGQSFNLYYPFDISTDFMSHIGITANFAKIVAANEAEDKYTMNLWQMEDAIKISWLEVGERMKITISHYAGKWILPPVFYMLAEICEDWKETQDNIWEYLQAQAETFNIELYRSPFSTNVGTEQASTTKTKEPAEPKKTSRRPWNTLKTEKQKAYTEAWYIWLEMNKEYDEDRFDETPKPTVADWVSRVKDQKVKIGKSERTLVTVKAYGNAGDIPKKNRKN